MNIDLNQYSLSRSQGYKPLYTGKFKSRVVLLRAILRELSTPPKKGTHGRRKQLLSNEEIADKYEVSASLVCKVRKQIYNVEMCKGSGI